ncbi:glycosyltransferase family 4 protein [Photobacterium sagamiensis]|uniref:glycosyltransferase family 4 protein n=1 Tax=Photobacterium sagamiensis TaxID=2910241 RepID=UPI003D132784
MKIKKHILVWDGIAFAGGSKNATLSLLKTLDSNQVVITVITKDPTSWQGMQLKKLQLLEMRWLANKTQGVLFFIKHLLLVFNLVIARLRFGKIDMVLGASGPGGDFTLYFARLLFRFVLVQLVHGPVACSRSIGRCLIKADAVFYLASTEESIQNALHRFRGFSEELVNTTRFQAFNNGLSLEHWPQACQQQHPQLYWAASLLKWKGLDLFVQALQQLDSNERPQTHICYIRPKQINLLISKAPVALERVHWHEMPDHLDRIRAESNIFVSTSHSEPFGLSILEAMAAGHCILIPDDGAYWDQVLVDGECCVKYQAGNAADLAEKIRQLQANDKLRRRLGKAAFKIAQNYVADDLYRPLTERIYHALGITQPKLSGLPPFATERV